MDEEQRKTFQRIFSPRSLAIVGISRTYSGLGGQFFLRNLQRAGYAGRIYLINPTAREIGGLPAFPEHHGPSGGGRSGHHLRSGPVGSSDPGGVRAAREFGISTS